MLSLIVLVLHLLVDRLYRHSLVEHLVGFPQQLRYLSSIRLVVSIFFTENSQLNSQCEIIWVI